MLPEPRAGPGVGEGCWASPGFWLESTNPQLGFSSSAWQPGEGLCIWWQLPAKWLAVDMCCPGRRSVHPPRLCGVWGSGYSQLAASHCHLGGPWLGLPLGPHGGHSSSDSSYQLRLCPLRGKPSQTPSGLCLPTCELLCSSGPVVNICRFDAKRKFKHSQQLEGSLDSGHRIQMEEASQKGLKFSLVFTGTFNPLDSLLGPQSTALPPLLPPWPRARKWGSRREGGPRQRCQLLLAPKDGWLWGQNLDLGERQGSGQTCSQAGRWVALQGPALWPQPLGGGASSSCSETPKLTVGSHSDP